MQTSKDVLQYYNINKSKTEDIYGIDYRNHRLKISACRGVEGNCRNALIRTGELQTEIETAVASVYTRRETSMGRHPPKVAIAACPNTCSQPQIKDIGFIAFQGPKQITGECSVCELCVQTCRENALVHGDSGIQHRSEHCMGCGWCLSLCPCDALLSEKIELRVLVGGKLGRHPVLAREICERIPPERVGEVTAKLLRGYVCCRKEGERLADTVSRLGTDSITGGTLCD